MKEITMSKGNVFISVITLLLLAPLCQAADSGQGWILRERPAKRARTKVPVEKAISLRGTASLKSMLAKAWLEQQLEQNALTPDRIEGISTDLRSLIAKEYYFLVNEKEHQLPSFLQFYFGGVTLQDLREHGKVPAIKIYLGKRVLDLQNRKLLDIKGGFKKENPQELLLSRNRLSGWPKDLTLAGLIFLDLAYNPLDEEAEKEIKSRFPKASILFY